MLSRLLFDLGVRGVAALPADVCPVARPHIFRGFAPRTVAVMTVPYRAGGNTGNLAAFAAAKDYHAYFAHLEEAVRAALAPLYPDAGVRVFADHSPYDEVKLAARAGLGVRGDSGLLLTPAYGSYVVIGELCSTLSPDELSILGIPFLPTPCAEGTCEHCGACRDACPGHCLPGGDRTGCLSAISQKKQPLTAAEEDALRRSAYAWGCDVCAAVCPHNQNAKPCPEGYFTTDILPGITPETLDSMTDSDYAARAFGWRPRAVLSRNLSLREERHD